MTCYECHGSGLCDCIICGVDTMRGRVAGPCVPCKGRAFRERHAAIFDKYDPREAHLWERIPAADGNKPRRIFIPTKGLK